MWGPNGLVPFEPKGEGGTITKLRLNSVQEFLHLEFSLAYGSCCSLQSNKGWLLGRVLSISKYFT